MITRAKLGLALVALGIGLFSEAHAQAPSLTVPHAKQCLDNGGAVQIRQATFGTNGNTPLKLAGVAAFCEFISAEDHSSIFVLMDTLTTTKPTLAALAYYAKVKFRGKCEGGPGSCYCTQLGGTDSFGGINAAGGGWVLGRQTNNVLDACIFPDMSSIDAYGLFYHSAGIIRGRDLSGVLGYKNPY
jgi:hypothetical protein